MRRAMLLIIGFGAGSGVFILLILSVAAQCAVASEARDAQLSIPYFVDGTQLQVLEMVSYDGPFWEDLSDDEVTEIASLLVKNTGTLHAARGEVIVEWADMRMIFEFTGVPPGAQVLILEKDRKLFRQDMPKCCYGWVQEAYPEVNGAVTVQSDDKLLLKNETADLIQVVSVQFKNYDPGSGFFIGGITYCAETTYLKPGEVREILPYHYAPGYSKIITVTTSVAE